MTIRQAKTLREGDLVTAIMEDPTGGESRWIPEENRWIYRSVRAGQVVEFQRLIPKVRIVRNGPWKDGHDQMLFCSGQDGQRAWLNIGNAESGKDNARKGQLHELRDQLPAAGIPPAGRAGWALR